MTMPKYNPNNDTPPKQAEMPPEGNCRVLVISCEEATSKKTGNPMLKFALEVCEGQEGEGYWIYFYLVAGNEYYDSNLGSIYRAFGIDGERNPIPEPRMFLNRKAVIRVKHKQDPGYEKKAEIKYWLPADDSEAVAREMNEPAPQDDPEDVPF